MKKPVLALILVILISLIGLWALFHSRAGVVQSDLNEAHAHYQQGMNAKTIVEAESSFNAALEKYLEVEKILKSHNKLSYVLYENIANTLLQLQQYPLSLYYYTQASVKLPRNEDLKLQIDRIKGKLGVKSKPPITKHRLVHANLSLDEGLKLFAVLGTLTIAVTFLSIWRGSASLRYGAWVLAVISLFLVSTAFYTQFFAPIEAIVIESSLLYQGEGEHFPRVSEEPVVAGEQVYVLSASDDGHWLKVSTLNNVPGFASTQKVRLIEP